MVHVYMGGHRSTTQEELTKLLQNAKDGEMVVTHYYMNYWEYDISLRLKK